MISKYDAVVSPSAGSAHAVMLLVKSEIPVLSQWLRKAEKRVLC